MSMSFVRLKLDSTLLDAMVRVMSRAKFLTSASISTLSGMSMSSSFFLASSSFALLFMLSQSRLSVRPGNATPTTILFLPSLMILPLVTVTLLNVSFGSTAPLVMQNGTLISSSLSPTFTFLVALFVYSKRILTWPLLPARSSGLMSLPSS